MSDVARRRSDQLGCRTRQRGRARFRLRHVRSADARRTSSRPRQRDARDRVSRRRTGRADRHRRRVYAERGITYVITTRQRAAAASTGDVTTIARTRCCSAPIGDAGQLADRTDRQATSTHTGELATSDGGWHAHLRVVAASHSMNSSTHLRVGEQIGVTRRAATPRQPAAATVTLDPRRHRSTIVVASGTTAQDVTRRIRMRSKRRKRTSRWLRAASTRLRPAAHIRTRLPAADRAATSDVARPNEPPADPH